MRRLLEQFLRFGMVGTVGLVVDVAVLYLAMAGLGLNPYLGRLVSYLAAATTTWALNRSFTFQDAQESRLRVQWARFLAVNAVGGAANYAVYAALIASGGLFALHPVLAVAAGALAGMLFNFTFSRRFVFRSA